MKKLLLLILCLSISSTILAEEKRTGQDNLNNMSEMEAYARALKCEEFVTKRGEWLLYIRDRHSSSEAMKLNNKLRMLECESFVFHRGEWFVYADQNNPAEWDRYSHI